GGNRAADTFSLHDALPICARSTPSSAPRPSRFGARISTLILARPHPGMGPTPFPLSSAAGEGEGGDTASVGGAARGEGQALALPDRKSTRLNSSHAKHSYA